MRLLLWLSLFLVSEICFAQSKFDGLWQTYNEDKTPSAIVEMTSEGGEILGKVVKLFPSAGRDNNPVCEACSGSQHNRPILGLTILWGIPVFAASDTGYILDPETGHVYHAQLSLMGNQLNIKGYIGVPLFGRNVTWTRFH